MMIGKFFRHLALKTAEKSLHYALDHSADTKARQALLKHQGKILRIELLATPWVFLLEISGSTILLKDQDAALPINAEFAATPLNALGLLLSSGPASILPPHIILKGDLEFIQALHAVIKEIDLDWEEMLSQYTGDTGAHYVGQYARKLRRYAAHTSESFTRSTREYLQEELRAMPARAEINIFLEEIDILRNDTARLAARIALLTAKNQGEDMP